MRLRRFGIAVLLLVAVAALTACRGVEATPAEKAAPAPVLTQAQRLLSNSVRATGKVLSRTNTPSQLRSASRSFSRQLDPVDEALRLLAGAKVPEDQVAAKRALTEAAQRHRGYVVLLARATATPPNKGRGILDRARLSGRQTRDAYGRYQKAAPDAADVVAGVDLTDTLGIAQAMRQQISDERLAARRADERRRADEQRRAAAAAAAARRAAAPTAAAASAGCNPSGGNPANGPVISCVRVSASGGTISATVDYCDRTPGLEQRFQYDFIVFDAGTGSAVGRTIVPATSRWACRSISSGPIASVGYGTYYVQANVQNLSMNVSGGSSSTTVSIR